MCVLDMHVVQVHNEAMYVSPRNDIPPPWPWAPAGMGKGALAPPPGNVKRIFCLA